MFTHLKIIDPIDLKTIEGPAGRFYITPQQQRYPSITTILGSGEKPWLEQWRTSLGHDKAALETKRATDRGTAIHTMAEKYLNNDPQSTHGQNVEHVADFNKLRLFLNKIDNIITQESALWSDTMKVAGRVDCVGEYKGKLSIIDFKSSTNDKNKEKVQDYFLQTTAYALMFQERYNIQIDNIVILMTVEKGIVPLVFTQSIDSYIEPLLNRISSYHSHKH